MSTLALNKYPLWP